MHTPTFRFTAALLLLGSLTTTNSGCDVVQAMSHGPTNDLSAPPPPKPEKACKPPVSLQAQAPARDCDRE
jgi:hypothetical protein